MQHYPRCSKHTIQSKCKSARCKQIIAVETVQEMYATVPTHFPICGQLYHMIMQTKECEKERAPAPPAPPPLPAHGPVHVLVHVLGLGQAHHSLNLFLILVPSSSEKPCFQNSIRQTVEWKKIKEVYIEKYM